MTDGARRVVIVGGVAGGMSAATRLRRNDSRAQVTVLERGGAVSFANCGLAYYLGGVIGDRDDLLLQTPERLAARFDLDVRIRSEAVEIDVDGRRVRVQPAMAGDPYWLPYDDLILATGATPSRPDIPGADLMHTLRSMEDVDRLATLLTVEPVGSAVVIGGGYIGIEMADNLLRRGAVVSLVHRGDHLLGSLDPEMAHPVHEHVESLGIDLRLGSEPVAVDARGVTLRDGSRIEASLVVAATGVRPDAGLAAAAGIRLGRTGGIAVDEFGRTSAPGVFAVGDVAEKRDASGESRVVPLAGPANRDGRYVADTVAGRATASPPALGTAIVDIAGLAVASVGWTEAHAQAIGIEPIVVHTHPSSRAAYFPGGSPLAVKVIVDPAADRIVGAQIVGTEAVDTTIDVIATAMLAQLPASRLSDLDLAYAPQFGSAKSPLNMVGYIMRNRRSGESPAVQWHEVDDWIAEGASVVDVRSAVEFAAGGIPGASNIPLEELRHRLDELGAGRIIVHCQVGQRGHTATRLLRDRGIDAVNLDGGYSTWAAGTAALMTKEHAI